MRCFLIINPFKQKIKYYYAKKFPKICSILNKITKNRSKKPAAP